MNTIQITSPPSSAQNNGRGRRVRQRKGVTQNARNGNNRNAGANQQQTKKKKKRNKKNKKVVNKSLLAEYGECGVLFAKAATDPFWFVNNAGSKLPCVPSGPQTKTQRGVAYLRGTLSTGSNGYGFLMLSPYRIVSDEPTASRMPLALSTSAFASTSFATTATGVVNYTFVNSPLLRAQNPAYRIVAAGLKINPIGPPLYSSGRIGYAQFPNFHDTWSGTSIDSIFGLPEAISHRVSDLSKNQFSWRFSSALPQALVQDQGEFMLYQDFDAYPGHCMAIGISGAPGSGTGFAFEWEAVVLYEYQSILTGTIRTVPETGVFTDSSVKAAKDIPEYVAKHRGETTGHDIESVLRTVAAVTGNDDHIKSAEHVLNLMHRVAKIDLR